MLGSAIPKRWVVSLALVGLVSLFMASYAAVWTGPAYAGTVVPTGSVLSNLSAPIILNLQTNQAIGLSVSPIDDNGNINLGMPEVKYTWNAGACGTLSDSASRTPIFTAGSGKCSGTITVHANQGVDHDHETPLYGANVPASGHSITVNVSAPAPAAAPTAVSTDPVTVPDIVPTGLSASDVSMVLPSTGGAFSVPQASGDTGQPIKIQIPSGAIDSGTAAAVRINVVSQGDVAAPPVGATEGASSGTFTFGSTIIEVQWYDESGSALDSFQLNAPAEICVPYTQADIDAANGGPDGLSVWRHNGTEWILMNSSVNTGNQTVCARTLNFSFFALGLSVPAPDSLPEPELPATGDYTPGVGALILAMMAGIALVAAGAFTARRARRVRETS